MFLLTYNGGPWFASLPSAVVTHRVMLMEQDTQWLYHLLAEVQLERFYLRFRDSLNITHVEHFAYIKESDLKQIGISKPGQYTVVIFVLFKNDSIAIFGNTSYEKPLCCAF